MKLKKLVVVGVGLLGGSLALAARKKGLAREVWGLGRHAGRLKLAKKRGLISHASTNPAEAFEGADLIVLCSPFSAFESWLKLASHWAPASCVVTDVGSVKGGWVMRWERAARPLVFVGSHPMAGSEKTGFEHATASLFKGAPCIVTPTPSTRPAALARVKALWKSLGGRVHLQSPAHHDRLIGRFSHLTHAASFALSQTAGRGLKPRDFALAGPSYWEATRVASSDAGLWADIFSYNRKVLRAEIGELRRELGRLAALKGGALRRRLEAISREAGARRK